MGVDNLSPEMVEEMKACTSREEMLELAKEEKLELSLEDLDGAAGGIWEYVPLDDGDERTGIEPANAHEAYKRGEIGYADLDW